MKKIVSIFLVVSLLASFAATAFAAASADISICHSLTCDGKKIYAAQPGEEIKVILTFESSNGKPFDIKNIQSEVAYDTDFFELADDEDIKVLASPEKSEWQMQESKHYEYRVFAVFAMFPNTQEGLLHCESSQVMAEYTLKVKDTAQTGDSGFVKSLVGEDVNVFGPDFEQYGESASDLTVVIGTPVTTYKLTYMNGTEQFAVSEVAGETNIINGPSPSEGLVFLGWEDSNGKLWKPGDSYSPSVDMTFTAKWGTPVQYFTLTFDTNGGNTIEALREVSGTIIELSSYVPTRSGYTFDGWYKDAALTQQVTSVTLNTNTTLYAKWKTTSTEGGGGGGGGGAGGGGGGGTTQKHTITFKETDGIELGSVEITTGTIVDLSKYKYNKQGYTFEGWYADKELTHKVTSIKLTEDITFYAKWVAGTNAGYHPEILTTEHYAYIMGRDGGLICPQENITRAEVATIFFRLLTEDVRKESLTKENAFSDVAAGEWYNTAISTLTQLEILKGRTESSFEPDAYITRAEFTTIAARFSDGTYVGKDYFTDTDGHWAKEYINTAANLGWIVGENGIFRPDDNITRAEVMTLVNRVLNRIPESEEDLLDGMTKWADNADTSAWYYLAVQEATNSHDYDMKADGVHEKWTALTENPNWAEIEN